jgi:fluoroquinolone transport system permease protein
MSTPMVSALPSLRLMLSLLLADLRNVTRDGLLAFLIVAPLMIALIFRFAMPDQAALDLIVEARPELELLVSARGPLLMSIIVAMSPGLIGAVYGLLLVDERDERTLAVLRVMPVSFAHYLIARMATPCVLSILMTIAAYPVAGLAPLPLATIAVIALAGATIVPVVTLTIVAFAANKVAALAIMRVLNALLALPILAYFATPLQEILAWPLPSFWQMKALWLAADGEPFLPALLLAPALNIRSRSGSTDASPGVPRRSLGEEFKALIHSAHHGEALRSQQRAAQLTFAVRRPASASIRLGLALAGSHKQSASQKEGD